MVRTNHASEAIANKMKSLGKRVHGPAFETVKQFDSVACCGACQAVMAVIIRVAGDSVGRRENRG